MLKNTVIGMPGWKNLGESTKCSVRYNTVVKQARQSLAATARSRREEGPDSIEQGDG